MMIIHENNVPALRTLRGAEVHMAYLDPPFMTGRTQCGKLGSYRDPLKTVSEFVLEISIVVSNCWDLLSETGSLVVHVDYRTVHDVKVALDATFGRDKFASEIIWSYKRWPSKTNNFQRTHDTLLRYVKCPGKQRWNQLYQPLSASTLATWGKRSQRAQFEQGKRKRSVNTSQESPGAPLGDVWEIPILAPVSRERTGYPTQKPEALLERLILSCTNEGDTVLDPYLGSGTTLAVAKRLGRNGIGIDRNHQAIEVAKKRLGLCGT